MTEYQVHLLQSMGKDLGHSCPFCYTQMLTFWVPPGVILHVSVQYCNKYTGITVIYKCLYIVSDIRAIYYLYGISTALE